MFAQNTPISLNLPTVAPAFNWDFANGTFLNPRIAFSRNSGTASHFNELGVLKSDSANIPRFEHVQNVSRGLLIESAATNLLSYSSQLDNAVWVKTTSTITANATTAPDGTVTSDKLINNNGTVGYISQSATYTAGVTYTFSFYAKAAERNSVSLLIYGTNFGGSNIGRTFTLTGSGSVSALLGTIAPISASIEYLKSDWYICTLTVVCAISHTAASFQIRDGDDGDGSSGRYIWGVQLEAGAINTSHIPTTTSALTRALDLLSIPVANFDYWRSDEYSFLVIFTGNSVGTCCINDFHDGTANERIYLESVDGVLTFKIVDGGVEQCSLSLGTVVTGTEYRVAVAIKLNDVAASINGAACVTDTSATLPTITAHNLGSNYAGANQMNGTLSLIRGYAARLPNSQLETLTL